MSLGEALAEAFPRLFEMTATETGDLECVKLRPNLEVVIQGVEADMNTPLYWLQLNMSYLDNFLYISFHFN